MNTVIAPFRPRLTPRPHDKNWQDAGRLMAEHDIPEDKHELMHENVATYLAHRTFGTPSARWQAKLERELAHPYTDDQVLQRVDQLQNSLLENLSQLPTWPKEVYLTGSFSRGRLGASSDLDGYGVVADGNLKDSFKVYADRDADPSQANLFPFAESCPGYNRAMLMVAGASVKIDPQHLKEDGYLRKTYADVQAHVPEKRRETNPLYEYITGKVWKEGLTPQEKVDQFEGKTLKSKMFGWGLSFGGTLAGAPLIGAAICKAADLMVTQHHTDATAS